MPATTHDASNQGRWQQHHVMARATAATTRNANNNTQSREPRAMSTTTGDASKQCAVPATTGDASNNKRCHIVFSFSITEHRGIHLANCLIMPAITRDDSNHTRFQRPRAMIATTDDVSNNTRCREQHTMTATTSDNSDASSIYYHANNLA